MPSYYEVPPRGISNRGPQVFVILALALLIGFSLGIGALWYVHKLSVPPQGPALEPNAAERTADPQSPQDSEEREAVSVFKNTKDSVVNVDSVLLQRGFDMRIREQQTGTGSGFVWDDEGRIVTNFHVVKDAIINNLNLRVVMSDRSEYQATIVGASADNDLAVIHINAPKEKLKKVKIGRSNDLEVGRKVFAIGNPYGLSLTMTKGIISALDRSIESPSERTINGVIQIDAPINPGNSGGPLLDKDGRLIGVNTAITSPSGGNVGIGFAIPVDTVNSVVTELIRHGKIPQADAGIRLVDQWRLRRAGYQSGVMIQALDPKGPAAQAGLLGVRENSKTGEVYPGDLILALNGEQVRGNTEFARMIGKFKPGDKVRMTFERDDNKQDVEVTLRGI